MRACSLERSVLMASSVGFRWLILYLHPKPFYTQNHALKFFQWNEVRPWWAGTVGLRIWGGTLGCLKITGNLGKPLEISRSDMRIQVPNTKPQTNVTHAVYTKCNEGPQGKQGIAGSGLSRGTRRTCVIVAQLVLYVKHLTSPLSP